MGNNSSLVNKARFSYQTVAVYYQSILPINLLILHHLRFFPQKSALHNRWFIS